VRACAAVLAGLLGLAGAPDFRHPASGVRSEPDILASVAALPPHLIDQLTEPIGFVQASTGEYLVLDRRQHTVYGIDASRERMRRVVQIGRETGEVLRPAAIAIGPDDHFAVADAPAGRERVQIFDLAGTVTGGFYLARPSGNRLVIRDLVLNGIGAMAFTGTTFLISQPESEALFSEFTPRAAVLRNVGVPRATGFESDRDLHWSLNVGIPVIDPTGGFFFVFQTGLPMFRKYDANGALVFERHIEGVELDGAIGALPTTWPARPPGTHPVVTSLVRAAAVDAAGRLWISLTLPYTYVYDARGEKVRTVQFRGAGIMSPTSLFFTRSGRLLTGPGGYLFEGR